MYCFEEEYKPNFNDKKFYIKELDLVIETDCDVDEIKNIRIDLYKDKEKEHYKIQDVNKKVYNVSRIDLETFCYLQLRDTEFYNTNLLGADPYFKLIQDAEDYLKNIFRLSL